MSGDYNRYGKSYIVFNLKSFCATLCPVDGDGVILEETLPIRIELSS